MEIKKIFTEIETDYGWKVTNRSYEEWQTRLNSFESAVRLVEKTFNSETFEITEKTIKKTERRLNPKTWDIEVVETM